MVTYCVHLFFAFFWVVFTKFTLPCVAGEVITAEAPNLHRTRSRHKGTPAKAQGASNASDFVCQEITNAWSFLGVMCVMCELCVMYVADVCVGHVMVSFAGICW